MVLILYFWALPSTALFMTFVLHSRSQIWFHYDQLDNHQKEIGKLSVGIVHMVVKPVTSMAKDMVMVAMVKDHKHWVSLGKKTLEYPFPTLHYVLSEVADNLLTICCWMMVMRMRHFTIQNDDARIRTGPKVVHRQTVWQHTSKWVLQSL